MKAQLLTIGDELLIGQTTNTNAAWLGEHLSLLGVDVVRTVTVGDEAGAMRTELDRGFADARLVVVTGGLGPTHDDRTREVVAQYFDAPLRTDEDVLEQVRAYYEQRNRPMPEVGPTLARLPEGFEPLENPVGAAVGMWYEGENRVLVVLPGIPAEMEAIFEASVEPRLERRPDVRDVTHRTLVTAGIGESSLQDRLGDLSDVLDERLHLAYLPSTSGVRLRLTADGRGPTVEDRLGRLEAVIRDRADAFVIGTGDTTLEQAIGDLLRERDATLAAAESATGGLIGHRVTGVSGSSDYFLGSVVAYSNSVKQQVLGVDPEALRAHGAVSEPVARQMAAGVRNALGATVGVSTTGIAGPTGGTPDKPVGTVWLGYADETGTETRRHHFVKDRSLNKELFTSAALELVRRGIR